MHLLSGHVEVFSLLEVSAGYYSGPQATKGKNCSDGN